MEISNYIKIGSLSIDRELNEFLRSSECIDQIIQEVDNYNFGMQYIITIKTTHRSLNESIEFQIQLAKILN